MIIKASKPTEYHYRGLVYRWEAAGDELEVPDELGRYLMGRGYGVFSASGPVPDPTPVTHTTDAGGIGHTAGADDGDEDEG